MEVAMDLGDVIGCLPIQLELGHRTELESLIQNLPIMFSNGNDRSANELKISRFEKLLQLYSEEPQLLDAVLTRFVDRLLSYVEWPSDDNPTQAASNSSDSTQSAPLLPLSVVALNWLQILTRFRGYKVMIRLLPHEVTYMSPLLTCLEFYARCDTVAQINENARLVFVLSAWLMIICKNPFNLAKFDNAKRADAKSNSSSAENRPVAERIIDCMSRLQKHYILREESGIISTLLAQILTRNQDNLDVILPRISTAIEVIRAFESEADGGIVLISNLRLLISLFKCGKRKEMKVCATRLLDAVMDRLLGVDCLNIEVRNLTIKLLQRVALVLLRPRLADWRYKCGYRSLEESLVKGRQNLQQPDLPPLAKAAAIDGDEEEEDDDVPYDVVEKLLGEFLAKIYDRDSVVRWTAAKGAARICARLNRSLAADVVAAVIADSFNAKADAAAWHGGSLALAELCRRGCLLPDQVPEVVGGVLSKGLLFEQSMIGFSVGVSVRDAACYICWAFARAYEARILKSCLPSIAGDLVCLALFDREVNIRRAASAAFQENVGRNDCFPHGIQVLTIIDYADVSLIKNCYLKLSKRVAHYAEYRRPLLDHLAEAKSRHWDETIRELAAGALEILAPMDADYSRDVVFPKVCDRLADNDPTVKHGTLFAISGLLTGLFCAGELREFENLRQSAALLNFVHTNLTIVGNHRVEGYALLAKAMCRFIRAMCAVGAPLTDAQLGEYHNVLDAVISDKNERLHSYAADAFRDLMKFYGNARFHLLQQRIFTTYFLKISGSVCSDELTRSSAITPLAYIPTEFLASKSELHDGSEDVRSDGVTLAEDLLLRLLNAINDVSTPKWVFARVAAIKSLSEILLKFIPPSFQLSRVIDSLILVSDDYTSSVNGDVGRFARRAAVLALVQLLPIAYERSLTPANAHEAGNSEASEARVLEAVGRIIQRCCESIDNLRATACTALSRLLRSTAEGERRLPIMERKFLEEIFLIDDDGSVQIDDDSPRQDADGEMAADSVSTLSSSAVSGAGGSGGNSGSFKRIDWMHAKGYLRLQPLLGSPSYGLSALEGFVLSAGSIAEWTSQSAYAGIALHLKPIKKDAKKLESFVDDLLKIYARIVARKCSVSPILLLFRMLLNDRVFAVFEKNPDEFANFSELCSKTIRIALGRCQPKVKRLAISVMGCLLQFNPESKLYRNCASTIISFLSSPYIALREAAVEQLFDAVNAMDDDIDGSGEGTESGEMNRRDKIFTLLTQTPWTETEKTDEEKISAAKAQLLEFFLPVH